MGNGSFINLAMLVLTVEEGVTRLLGFAVSSSVSDVDSESDDPVADESLELPGEVPNFFSSEDFSQGAHRSVRVINQSRTDPVN